jgi:hypothetical protein
MKAKEVAMVVAISVLAAFFVGLLYDAIIQEPTYEDFCNATSYRTKYTYALPEPVGQPCTVYQPTVAEQEKINQCYTDKGNPEFNMSTHGCQREYIECNYCNKYYTEASERYSRNLFAVIAPIGFILVVLGVYLAAEVIGTGFMFSGILLLVYSTMRYFGSMSKILRVVVIGIELFLLLLISWKKLRK